MALLSPLLAASPARAGVFGNPLTDSSICGSSAVAATLGATTVFQLSTRCAAHCRQTQAMCHALVQRVITCYTTWYADQAALATANCTELHSPPCVSSVRSGLAGIRTIIQGERGSAFVDCDTWAADCQMNCP